VSYEKVEEIKKFKGIYCTVVTLKKTSVASIRKQTMPTERPPLVGEISVNFLRIDGTTVRFPALPDFLRSSGSGTGSTQPREYN
jgi:hypothetical protein